MRLTDAPGIDHLMIGTHDLAAAHATLERLGFAVSPRGVHEELGTANHVATFANGTYLEILAVLVPGPANAAYRTALDSLGEGVTGLALRTDDAAVFLDRARARGIAAGPKVDFSRWVEEAEAFARFSIVRLDKDTLPPLTLFACQHWTPQLVWRPDRLDHPNTVQGIVEIVMTDPDRGAREVISRLFHQPAKRDGDDSRMTVDPVDIRFRTADAQGRGQVRIESVTFSVADLDRTRTWLSGQSVPFDTSSARLSIAPSHALGTRLDFRQA